MARMRGAAAIALVVLTGGCRSGRDHSAGAAAAVWSADSAWAQTFARKDLAGYLSFVDSNATMHPPNAPAITGIAGIRGLIEGFLALPGLTGTWQPTTVVAARSGELAYSTGTYEMSYNDSTGARVTDRGKYLEVWRRQPDRSWKLITESFNADR